MNEQVPADVADFRLHGFDVSHFQPAAPDFAAAVLALEVHLKNLSQRNFGFNGS